MWRQLFSKKFSVPLTALRSKNLSSSSFSSSSRRFQTFCAATATTATILGNYSYEDCEAAASHLPHKFHELSDHPQTIPSTGTVTISQRISQIIEWFQNLIKFLARLTTVTMNFTPALLTSPVLLLKSPSLESSWWELLRCGIFWSGPCLTKLSQWIATRPDIFPQRFCKELELLQTQTHEHSWGETVKILDKIYGPNWSHYLIIDHAAGAGGPGTGGGVVTGSGLMGQVYHGYLHSKNPKQHDIEIALKILHPGVQEAIQADLQLLGFLIHSLETSMEWLAYLYSSVTSPFSSSSGSQEEYNSASIFDTTVSLSDAYSEFSQIMSSQINLRNEANAMIRFKHNFSKRKWQNRVRFAEPIDLLYFLKTGHYYPDPSSVSSSSRSSLSSLELQFPLTDNGGEDGGGVLIQTFEHGIPMATYLTEAKREKESRYTDPKPIKTNKQPHHRHFPTINGTPVTFHQVQEGSYTSPSSSSASSSPSPASTSAPVAPSPVAEIHEKHTSRDKEIAALGLDLLLKMLFEDNFIHGDLHPGNLLLTYDTSAPTHIFSLSHQPVQLTVLDTGLCTELNAEDRKNFVTLLKLVIEGDGVGVARLMMDKSRERNPKQVIIDPQGFERSMDHLLSNIFHNGGLKLANNGVSKLLNEVLLLCYKHRVRLESGFSSVMLAIGIVEGVGIQLDPEIDVVSRAAPFIIKTAARDFGLLPKQ